MLKKNIQQESIGVIFGLAHAFLIGLFPIVVHYGVFVIPALLFAALTTLLASGVAFFYMFIQHGFGDFREYRAHKPLFMITVLNIIIPHALLFIGASMTSGVNIVMLSLSEILFTLFFTQFIGEKTTLFKLLGAAGIFIGGLCILYNGKEFLFNIGDFLIIISTLSYPLGNFYSKKALQLVSPSFILFVRFFFGGIVLFILAIIVTPRFNLARILFDYWNELLVTGVVLIGISKIFWYESLKRLDISKAVSLVMTFPLFSLAVLAVFLQQPISVYQGAGILCMFIGVFFSLYRTSVDPSVTKYAPERLLSGSLAKECEKL